MKANNLVICEDKHPVSFEQAESRCCVVCSRQDEDTSVLLRKLSGLISLGGSEEVLYRINDLSIDRLQIGFFFKRGILLSNLTLKENINLPYHYFEDESNWAEYEKRVSWWTDFFKLEVDYNLRPAAVNQSTQKLVSYIRNLILQPEIYIIDDPFFQLSCIFRKKIVDCLLLLKEYNNFLVIGTSDIELIELLADDIIILEKGEILDKYELTGSKREVSLQLVKRYLEE